jgi:hypothetical protein
LMSRCRPSPGPTDEPIRTLPALNSNEIRTIVLVRTGRRLGKHTVERVLSEEPVPLRMVKFYRPYHEIEDGRERREAVVALRLDGWSAKAIASYLKVGRATVYRILDRWFEEGEEGLQDKPRGRPQVVRKVDLDIRLTLRSRR